MLLVASRDNSMPPAASDVFSLGLRNLQDSQITSWSNLYTWLLFRFRVLVWKKRAAVTEYTDSHEWKISVSVSCPRQCVTDGSWCRAGGGTGWRVMDLLQELAMTTHRRAPPRPTTFRVRLPSYDLTTNTVEGDARITETTSKFESGEGSLAELKPLIWSVPWRAQELWTAHLFSLPTLTLSPSQSLPARRVYRSSGRQSCLCIRERSNGKSSAAPERHQKKGGSKNQRDVSQRNVGIW